MSNMRLNIVELSYDLSMRLYIHTITELCLKYHKEFCKNKEQLSKKKLVKNEFASATV